MFETNKLNTVAAEVPRKSVIFAAFANFEVTYYVFLVSKAKPQNKYPPKTDAENIDDKL